MMSGEERKKDGRRTQVKNARGKCMYYKGGESQCVSDASE